MHEEGIDGLGKDFDPDRLHIDFAKERLAGAFKPRPERPRKPGTKPA